MRTPKEYNDNLKNRVITSKMLEDALFCCNKRAKNYRNKERECRAYRLSPYAYDKYDYEEKNREKKEEFYKLKELLLTVVRPDCIHKETYEKTFKKRIYDYEQGYEEAEKTCFRQNCYYDWELDREVFFRDIWVTELKEMYYLFYPFENTSFHSPLDKEKLSNYKGLSIIEIEQLKTDGKDINDLLSVQFVRKLIELIESSNFIYVA